jgi:hypothetical protein
MSANATMQVEMSPEFLFFLDIVEFILRIYAQKRKARQEDLPRFALLVFC